MELGSIAGGPTSPGQTWMRISSANVSVISSPPAGEHDIIVKLCTPPVLQSPELGSQHGHKEIAQQAEGEAYVEQEGPLRHRDADLEHRRLRRAALEGSSQDHLGQRDLGWIRAEPRKR